MTGKMIISQQILIVNTFFQKTTAAYRKRSELICLTTQILYNIMLAINYKRVIFMQKNVLILTMALNIGGAETHIFELANALAARGNRVTVFSAGGVYADKLRENGIEHIDAPLNRKDPVSLRRSYKIVSKFVKENRPCVIHSHTRISNFTARAVARKYRVPFISTVHFNFSTGFFQRALTNWGNRALAVSDDLKEYTAKEYGFDKDKIRVTVNGINLNTFCKKRLPDFKRELGIAENSKVILCVSRLDAVAGDHVLHVLKMAEQLYKDTPNSNIVIVGGGTRYEQFCKTAESINAKTKNNFIIMTGPQTDIYRYCNIADLFIGISRSALEAMACEVPVILLGNSGYLGMYGDDTKAACIETNFTCRGCPYPNDGEITELARDILANPEKYAKHIENALNIVKSRYSVETMAKDAEQSYCEAQKDVRPVDFVLCGYYGRHNLGDDMALKAFADNMVNRCGADSITLLSADSKNTKCKYINNVVHRFNLVKIYRIMKRTNVFVLGGGSILQDATSSRSMFYYTHIAGKAKSLGCKVMLYSNGVGPIIKKHNRIRAVKLLNKADMITVRDRRSQVYMRSIGVKNENIMLTADETFTLNKDAIAEPYEGLGEGKYLCINLRNSDINDKFIQRFSEFLNKAAEKYGYIPVLLPVHYSKDISILTHISKLLTCKHVLIDKTLPHRQTLGILNKCDVTIMERLHAVIFSCIYSKPFLAVNYDPKVLSFCIEMGMEDYVIALASFDKKKISKQFDLLMQNKSQLQKTLSEKAAAKQMLAQLNAECAYTLLKLR